MKIKLFTVLLLLFISSVAFAQSKRNVKKISADSIAAMTSRAELGDNNAQNTLGVWYYQGRYVRKDYETAVKWWNMSAFQGNNKAMGNLAMCYQLGNGVKTDSVKAMDLYQKAILRGNQSIIPQHEAIVTNTGSLFSSRLLAECYSKGTGVDADAEKAAQYYERIAVAGDKDSQFAFAKRCLDVGQNDRAAQWFDRAAAQGHAQAEFYAGYMRCHGLGFSQNMDEGMTMLRKASQKGCYEADYELGRLLLSGNGVMKDEQGAVAYLKKAAAVMPDAQWLLGQCYLNGQGTAKDYHFATQWFATAFPYHQQDFKTLLQNAQYDDYSRYLKALKTYYVDDNCTSALEQFKALEKAKVTEAAVMSAVCLADAKNPKSNEKKALKSLVSLAGKGFAPAAYYASLMYNEGRGTKKSIPAAVDMLTKAAQGGMAEAQCALGERLMKGDGLPQNQRQAAQWLLKAESQRRLSVSGAQTLAQCYRQGTLVDGGAQSMEERIEQLENTKPNRQLFDMLQLLF